MFLVPYNTDAPIYHYPIGTVGLIAANVLLFFAVKTGNVNEQTAGNLVLHFAEVNPTQWLTANFMHAGFMHLLGNMMFLWGFGLVVEGKLGWYRFLPIYLLVGILYGAMVQLTMLGSIGTALGASGVLFALMGMAMVWAPKNDMNCFFFIFLLFIARAYFFNMSIINFGLLFVGLQVVFFWLGDFSISSAALHLAGFAVGFPIGLLFLKLNWIDCEGWDLIHVWKGQKGYGRDSMAIREEAAKLAEKLAQPPQTAEQPPAVDHATALASLRAALRENQTKTALALFKKAGSSDPTGWELPEAELLALTATLHREEMWSESVPLLVQILRRFPERSVPTRLKLAHILVQAKQLPKQAIAVLEKLPENLPAELQERRQQIAELANKEIAEGTVEFEVQDW
ncbi:MAG: rhomboid family intramembrane serine protease [Pirellulales bacterium]